MGDGLNVSTADLARAGSQVASSSDPTSLGSSALVGVQGAVTTPQVGMGIGSAASSFCSALAARADALSASTQNQGEAITQSAQLYKAVDQDAANGFDGIYPPSLAI